MTTTHIIIINNIDRTPEQIKRSIEMKWVDVNVFSVESKGEFTAIEINHKGFKNIERVAKDGDFTKVVERVSQ